jgi:hypothetical protein
MQISAQVIGADERYEFTASFIIRKAIMIVENSFLHDMQIIHIFVNDIVYLLVVRRGSELKIQGLGVSFLGKVQNNYFK